MPQKSNRMNKIDEELKKEISSIISTELKNPHLTGLISVSKVKTTPDLRYAKVYISLLNCKNVKERKQNNDGNQNKEENIADVENMISDAPPDLHAGMHCVFRHADTSFSVQ